MGYTNLMNTLPIHVQDYIQDIRYKLEHNDRMSQLNESFIDWCCQEYGCDIDGEPNISPVFTGLKITRHPWRYDNSGREGIFSDYNEYRRPFISTDDDSDTDDDDDDNDDNDDPFTGFRPNEWIYSVDTDDELIIRNELVDIKVDCDNRDIPHDQIRKYQADWHGNVDRDSWQWLGIRATYADMDKSNDVHLDSDVKYVSCDIDGFKTFMAEYYHLDDYRELLDDGYIEFQVYTPKVEPKDLGPVTAYMYWSIPNCNDKVKYVEYNTSSMWAMWSCGWDWAYDSDDESYDGQESTEE